MSHPRHEHDELPDLAEARRAESFELALRQERCVESETPLGDKDSTRAATLKLLHAAFSTTTSPSQDDRVDELPFQYIRRFELQRRIGGGGFGDVYLATDHTLRREVAVKVPRLHQFADLATRKRFLRESEAAASLNHPNIVPVFEAGEEQGVLYIVSEYCDGPNLAQWLRARSEPTDTRTAAEIVQQLADAADHMHAQGMLHRDIKPANVLLSSVGDGASQENITPRLTDFGLAKDLSLSSGETKSGAFLGTLKYVSPEQLKGQTKALDAATDIYSLGVLLYEVLTHRVPHDGATHYEVLKSVCEQQAARPSEIVPTISADMDAICLKCLSPSSDNRYPTAAALRDDLQRFLDGQPVSARLPGVIERANRIAQHSLLVWCVVAVALPALGVLAYSLTRDERSRALDLDGVDDHLVVNSLSYDGGGPITLEAWVRPESESGGKIMHVGGLLSLQLHSENGLTPLILALREDEGFHLQAEQPVRLGEWVHLAGVYDGSRLALFVNGHYQQGRRIHHFDISREDGFTESVRFPVIELVPIWDNMTFAAGANPWAQPEYTEAFGGRIDEIRVSRGIRYSEDFVPDERFQTDENTLALFHFDSLRDGIATDASSNHNNGRIERSFTTN
ncbi:MAG: protein kinase [Planctomycetota bacterium]